MSGLAAVRDQSGLIMVGEPGEPMQFSPFDTWTVWVSTIWARLLTGFPQVGISYATFGYFEPPVSISPNTNPTLSAAWQEFTCKSTTNGNISFTDGANRTVTLTYGGWPNLTLSAAAGQVPALPAKFPALAALDPPLIVRDFAQPRGLRRLWRRA